MHPHCIVYYTAQNLDEDSLDILYKNNCWAVIPDSIRMINVPNHMVYDMNEKYDSIWTINVPYYMAYDMNEK